MTRHIYFLFCAAALSGITHGPTHAASFASDTLPTSAGDLKITPMRHATLMLQIKDTVIHVDPWGAAADYGRLPKADLILITHHHRDHLDAEAVSKIMKKGTIVVTTAMCAKILGFGRVLNNGESAPVAGISIEAVPAYNLVHKRPDGSPYHPKGEGNGYVLNIGERRIYIAGDTENTPEMKALESIDVAFLPANLPYTMSSEMFLDAVRAFKPRIVYPYHFHYGESQLAGVVKAMDQEHAVELRVRNAG